MPPNDDDDRPRRKPRRRDGDDGDFEEDDDRPRRRRNRDDEGDETGGLIPYKNGKALAAYYCGVFSLIPVFGCVLSVFAVVLGVMGIEGVEMAALAVSALCHRVPVIDGHTEAVSVKLKGNPTPEDVKAVLRSWKPEPQQLALPSAPLVPIRIHDAEDRPQVRRDVEVDNGMSVHVGRIRPCPLFGIKFTLLGHNTERGAAGGSILNAELAHAKGLL